jgi:hypothetical protein
MNRASLFVTMFLSSYTPGGNFVRMLSVTHGGGIILRVLEYLYAHCDFQLRRRIRDVPPTRMYTQWTPRNSGRLHPCLSMSTKATQV